MRESRPYFSSGKYRRYYGRALVIQIFKERSWTEKAFVKLIICGEGGVLTRDKSFDRSCYGFIVKPGWGSIELMSG